MLNKDKQKQLKSSVEKGLSICGCCYTPFIKPAQNIYRIEYKGKQFQLCSYSCYQKANKFKEDTMK